MVFNVFIVVFMARLCYMIQARIEVFFRGRKSDQIFVLMNTTFTGRLGVGEFCGAVMALPTLAHTL